MATIYRPSADRVSVADAKRLIVEALPPEEAYQIWEASDGSTEVRIVPDGGFSRDRMNAAFLTACESASIAPRYRYEPTRTDYCGQGLQDLLYTIGHDELVWFAGLYSLTVEIGAGPAQVAEAATAESPAVPTVAAETPKQRRARLLAMIDAESAAGRGHGALARITEVEKRTRPTADRSNIGKDIKKARKERDAERRGGALARLLG